MGFLRAGETLKGTTAPDGAVSLEINLCACTEQLIHHHTLTIERAGEGLQDPPPHRNWNLSQKAQHRRSLLVLGCQSWVRVPVLFARVLFL